MNSIHDICKKYNIKDYTINDDGSIDVNGWVNLNNKGLTEFPVTFNRVLGYFECSGNNLTTLKGGPVYVNSHFYCNYNKLTNLEHCPKTINGDFRCHDNQLTSLEFSPDYVGGYFFCHYNKLTDNYCETEIINHFYTSLKQSGLEFTGNRTTNYNEWRKLHKRKLIINDLFNRNM